MRAKPISPPKPAPAPTPNPTPGNPPIPLVPPQPSPPGPPTQRDCWDTYSKAKEECYKIECIEDRNKCLQKAIQDKDDCVEQAGENMGDWDDDDIGTDRFNSEYENPMA